MPIRPENRALYPPDWPEISLSIRRDRAGWRCECVGLCGMDHRGRCDRPHGGESESGAKVVLTVAHLDHTPQNCDPANLRAMCQGCHLRYDADHHAATARATRLARDTAGMDSLFGEAS